MSRELPEPFAPVVKLIFISLESVVPLLASCLDEATLTASPCVIIPISHFGNVPPPDIGFPLVVMLLRDCTIVDKIWTFILVALPSISGILTLKESPNIL